MTDVEIEVQKWKAVAAYLADCLAGTAEEVAFLKKYSKADKRRHALICQTVALSLKMGDLVGVIDRGYAKEGMQRVIERCERVQQECEAGLKS